jgi:DNA-binding CsgD family transcriptional regulator
MLQGDCQSVLEARNEGEFRGVVLRFAQNLGFEKVSAMTVVDTGGKPEFATVDNTPPALDEMASDPLKWQRDPVLQHCKRQVLPIVWGQGTFLAADAIDLWESRAPFGYRHGIALALHLPRGRHFMMGVDRDQPLPKEPGEVARMTAALSLFTVHAQDTALRLFDGPEETDHRPLTPRELEVLRWTMAGYTAQQVGDRLGIAERTVNMHSRHAMKKLGCASKHQAVLKALRLGLIR